MAGVDILHVPYKSNPLAITDLLGGADRHDDHRHRDRRCRRCKAGKLRALGVSEREAHRALLPDVPTIDEAGVKGYEMGYWFAAYVPAGTPPAVVKRLNELLVAATRSAPATSFYETTGVEAWTTTPDELGKFQAPRHGKWGKVVKAAGIEPE